MIREEQFIRLFVRHEPELRAFAATLMPRSTDTEDVVQDACVAMWQRIGDLDHEGAFRAWAYTFVRFTALNRIRKLKRDPLVFSENLVGILAAEAEGEADLAQAELSALESCLEKLSTAQRDLVQRYYRSAAVRMADVAAALDRSIAGLYKMLERTRHALRECIGKQLALKGFEVIDG